MKNRNLYVIYSDVLTGVYVDSKLAYQGTGKVDKNIINILCGKYQFLDLKTYDIDPIKFHKKFNSLFPDNFSEIETVL